MIVGLEEAFVPSSFDVNGAKSCLACDVRRFAQRSRNE